MTNLGYYSEKLNENLELKEILDSMHEASIFSVKSQANTKNLEMFVIKSELSLILNFRIDNMKEKIKIEYEKIQSGGK